MCFALLRGPALLPLGREKPAGGVSQRKKETKNSSPGEQAHFRSPSTPACFFTLGSGPEGPFLGLLKSPSPRPSHPLLPLWHHGPWERKGTKSWGPLLQRTPRTEGGSLGPLQLLISDWGWDREHLPRSESITILTATTTTPSPAPAPSHFLQSKITREDLGKVAEGGTAGFP